MKSHYLNDVIYDLEILRDQDGDNLLELLKDLCAEYSDNGATEAFKDNLELLANALEVC